MAKAKAQTSMRAVPIGYEREKVVNWLLELEGLNYHLGSLTGASYVIVDLEAKEAGIRKQITDLRHAICAVLPGEERRPMVGDAAGLAPRSR